MTWLLLALLVGLLVLGAAPSARAATSNGFDFPLGDGNNPHSPGVTQGWCVRDFSSNPHLGIDWGSPSGTHVYATSNGWVHNRGWAAGGYGNWIQIRHQLPDGSTWYSMYGHLRDAPLPGIGAEVGRRQHIGYVGTTGLSTGNHLHFAISSGSGVPPGYGTCGAGGTVDPIAFVNARRSLQVGPVGDGGLVRTPNGNVYRIVGGAPLHISNCDYTSGCAGLVQANDLSQYRATPRDGAIVYNRADGGVYRFAGGAPLWLSACNYGGGCGGGVEVDGHPFNVNDHMRAQPADGTLIANRDDGGVYRFAGGAPLWISSCDYAPGCGGPITAVDGGTFDRNGAISGAARMREAPADGTLIANRNDGGIYRFAGGAPLWISSCGYAPGCGGSITALDSGTFERNGSLSGRKRMRAAPVDGTVVRNVTTGEISRFAGGAPLWLSACDYGGGCAGAVALDGGTFSRNGALSGAARMRTVPVDGTYLRIRASNVFRRVAGGAALTVSDCAVLDGACGGAVAIDQGTLDAKARGRLRAAPADGTILRARPSDVRWKIVGGLRTRLTDSSGVQINDATVAGFAEPTVGGGRRPGTGTAGTGPGAGTTGKAKPRVCRITTANVRRGRSIVIRCVGKRRSLKLTATPRFGARPAARKRVRTGRTTKKGVLRFGTAGWRTGRYAVVVRSGGKTVVSRTVRVR